MHERNWNKITQCMQQLLDCSNTITTGDVARALAHADVHAAIAKAPVIYGHDQRLVDGVGFDIEVGDATIVVGSPCHESSQCNVIPDGIDALAKTLQALTKQELALEPCRASFPPPP